MKQFQAYEIVGVGQIELIDESNELWNACRTAYARAASNKSATYVWDADNEYKVDEYDCTYLALLELQSRQQQEFEVDE